jgi:hypothetical protein
MQYIKQKHEGHGTRKTAYRVTLYHLALWQLQENRYTIG